jgi:DNA-binding NarL/FixJ family response regulator
VSYRLLITSSVRLTRDGIRCLLIGCPLFSDITTAGTWAEIEIKTQDFRPDVILLDGSDAESLTLVPAVRALSDARIVAFGVEAFGAQLIACARAGVNAFCEAAADASHLIEAIRRLPKGELVISPLVAAALFRRVGLLEGGAKQPPSGQLTKRETDVFVLMGEGRSNKEIARHLNIRVTTVKNHVHNLLMKLGANTRTEAVTLLHRRRFADRGRNSPTGLDIVLANSEP